MRRTIDDVPSYEPGPESAGCFTWFFSYVLGSYLTVLLLLVFNVWDKSLLLAPFSIPFFLVMILPKVHWIVGVWATGSWLGLMLGVFGLLRSFQIGTFRWWPLVLIALLFGLFLMLRFGILQLG